MEREVKKPPKKSLAKAAGLKSTFVISPQEKELAMTAFGRGNDALLQKRSIREYRLAEANLARAINRLRVKSRSANN